MNQNLRVGDFTTGPKLPIWIARMVHHRWRFQIAVLLLTAVSALAFFGLKIPWRSTDIVDRPQDEPGLIGDNNLVKLPGLEASEAPDGAEQKASSDGSSNKKAVGTSDDNESLGGGGASSGGSQSSGGGTGTGGGSGSPTTCASGMSAAGGYTLPSLCGYPTASSTGPRYSHTSTSGSITTTHDGQIIERVRIEGSLDIRHNNVIVRDVTIFGTGTYALDIGQGMAQCPTNLLVEYTEINMVNAGNMDWGVYQRCAGGHTFDHIKVHNVGRGMMWYGNATITNSFFYSHRTQEGAHRTALSTHGGDNFTVTHNTFICVNTGCSSSVNMYSDYAPVTNYLFQDNLLAGGSICLRAGDSHQYRDQAHDIRVLNNRFSTHYYPECGIFQALGAFNPGLPGNLRSGNVYHETGHAVPGE